MRCKSPASLSKFGCFKFRASCRPLNRSGVQRGRRLLELLEGERSYGMFSLFQSTWKDIRLKEGREGWKTICRVAVQQLQLLFCSTFLSQQQLSSSPSSCFHCLCGMAWISVSGDNLVVMKVFFGNNWCDDPGSSATECWSRIRSSRLQIFEHESERKKVYLSEVPDTIRLLLFNPGSLWLYHCFWPDKFYIRL